MKVKFHKGIKKFVPEWNGNSALPAPEQMYAEIKPITMGDLMAVIDALNQSTTDGKVTNPRPIMEIARDVVPKYITLYNLESDDGQMTSADILEYPAFMSLVPELVTKLAELASIAEVEEKNSNTPLA